MSNNIVVPNEIITISANVVNNTLNNIHNKKISLYVNNINVGSSNINIDKNSSSLIPFKTSISEFGNNNCKFIIEDDDFELDNAYYCECDFRLSSAAHQYLFIDYEICIGQNQ